jgi:DNA-binding beta-propeller fold protein YncE
MDAFAGPADFSFDASTGEAFVADGYRNRRVAVVDYKTGAIKRYWGAFGNNPVDSAAASPARGFGSPVRCAEVSKDGLVYVCDRSNNRIQVFKKTGEFVKEKVIMPQTRGDGAVWDVTFSRDAQQRFLYVADGANMKVHVLDRQTLNELTAFGAGGRLPGQFYAVHSIATDSKGNIYTVETLQGKRLQKFNFKGIRSVTSKSQGVVWPGRGQ